MAKPDYKTLSAFRAIIIERNKLWCPDPNARLRMHVQEHFIERLFERYPINTEAAQVFKDVMAWIKKNYEILQFENTFETKREYRIDITYGKAVVILFNGQVSLRTCFKPGQQ